MEGAKKQPEKAQQTAALRLKAETEFSRKSSSEIPSPAHSQEKLFQELRVHQIELEMQNEELRRSQCALEEARDRYLDLFEFAPVGYITLCSKGVIREINLTGCNKLGLTRSKLINRRFSKFINPKESDRWHRQYLDMLKKPDLEGHDFEAELLREDGTGFYALLECRCKSLPNSGPILRITMSDITERVKLQEQLRIAAIAFDTQEGIIITDSKGFILKVNEAFTRLTGYEANEAVGKKPNMLASGRHSLDFYNNMWMTLREDSYWQGEIWNKRKDGRIYAEWLNITAVVSNTGDVSHYVGTFSDITTNKESEAEVHRLAYYDPLTSLPNRTLLNDRISQALAGSYRSGHYGSILFLDLDNFKKINDTRGHAIGDLLLSEVASRLLGAVRDGDTVSRLGGDEFVVMLEDLSSNEVEAAHQTKLIGEKLLESISLPYTLDRHEYFFTISIGAAIFFNHNHSSVELLKQADIAMYQAESDGRNRLRFFDANMQATIDARESLEEDLRKALHKHQFCLHYQIQVDDSNRPLGAEALIRWVHPERGIVSPVQFIPLAEESGLILCIGQWVLESACEQLKKWEQDVLTSNLVLSVNVSAKQFNQPDFVSTVQAVVQRYSIRANRLKLELTESMLVAQIESVIETMKALREIGVRLSLDDFGTGYSSLQYLKLLPLNQVKIDQSFVRDLVEDSADRAIVRTIITMAESLKMDVIAEGVETNEQRDLLFAKGCSHYQGYLFGRPVLIEQFEALLQR